MYIYKCTLMSKVKRGTRNDIFTFCKYSKEKHVNGKCTIYIPPFQHNQSNLRHLHVTNVQLFAIHEACLLNKEIYLFVLLMQCSSPSVYSLFALIHRCSLVFYRSKAYSESIPVCCVNISGVLFVIGSTDSKCVFKI